MLFSSNSHSYKCNGYISEFTLCTYSTKEPTRNPIKIPKNLHKEHEVLSEFKKPVDFLFLT